MRVYNPWFVGWWLTAFCLFCLTSPVHGEMRPFNIVCDPWPPYQEPVGDEVVGICADLVRQTFKEMGTPISSIKSYPWKRALAYLKKGTADALFSANFNPQREAYAHYPAEPLIVTPWVLWGQKKHPPSMDVLKGDLKDLRIGVVSGYTYTKEFWEALRTHGHYNAVTSDAQNFLMLAAGRVDFVAAELGNGLYLTRKLELSNIVPFTDHPIKTDGLYIIFNKSKISLDFVDRFSKTLARVKQGKEYRKRVSGLFYPYEN